MKNILFFISFLILNACTKNEDAIATIPENPAENSSILVQPSQTDANYSVSQESHYVVRNTKKHLNKLFLFFGGTSSIPKDYNFNCDQAASIGFDVISLSYPNSVATGTLGTNSDPLIFDTYRDELCLGNQVSSVVNIDNLNCIVTRTTKLILFLKNTYPDQNWGQYLTNANTLQWNKIIVGGHSQGSGHACYLGKKYLVDRVLMFAGPNDYHYFYNKPGNWLTVSGVTPLKKHFSLLHINDELASFSSQVSNLKGLGLLASNENPVLVDNLVAPYSNAQSMSINIPANSNHAAPIGRNSILPNVWTYMLTTD